MSMKLIYFFFIFLIVDSEGSKFNQGQSIALMTNWNMSFIKRWIVSLLIWGQLICVITTQRDSIYHKLNMLALGKFRISGAEAGWWFMLF